jgi:hypothetical protein
MLVYAQLAVLIHLSVFLLVHSYTFRCVLLMYECYRTCSDLLTVTAGHHYTTVVQQGFYHHTASYNRLLPPLQLRYYCDTATTTVTTLPLRLHYTATANTTTVRTPLRQPLSIKIEPDMPHQDINSLTLSIKHQRMKINKQYKYKRRRCLWSNVPPPQVCSHMKLLSNWLMADAWLSVDSWDTHRCYLQRQGVRSIQSFYAVCICTQLIRSHKHRSGRWPRWDDHLQQRRSAISFVNLTITSIYIYTTILPTYKCFEIGCTSLWLYK